MIRRYLLIVVLAAGSVAAAHAGSSADLVAQADRHWSAGEMEKAQQAFEAAAKAAPKSTDVQLRLAGFQLANRQMGKSIATYQQVISLDPKSTRAWLGLGVAYLHGGSKDLAKAAFEEALKIDPTYKPKLAPVLAKLETADSHP